MIIIKIIMTIIIMPILKSYSEIYIVAQRKNP